MAAEVTRAAINLYHPLLVPLTFLSLSTTPVLESEKALLGIGANLARESVGAGKGVALAEDGTMEDMRWSVMVVAPPYCQGV